MAGQGIFELTNRVSGRLCFLSAAGLLSLIASMPEDLEQPRSALVQSHSPAAAISSGSPRRPTGSSLNISANTFASPPVGPNPTFVSPGAIRLPDSHRQSSITYTPGRW